MPTVYSYVVARDYGFAPNPFYGVCSLATCKQEIRRMANVGDLVIGTGSARRNLTGRVIFAMEIDRIATYDEYWQLSDFVLKRPNLYGSVKQSFGDNIYHRDSLELPWCQLDSHHSLNSGKRNMKNLVRDTRVNRVLLGQKFTYWGGDAPFLPYALRTGQNDICARRGHRIFSGANATVIEAWFNNIEERGVIGFPFEWRRRQRNSEAWKF